MKVKFVNLEHIHTTVKKQKVVLLKKIHSRPFTFKKQIKETICVFLNMIVRKNIIEGSQNGETWRLMDCRKSLSFWVPPHFLSQVGFSVNTGV